MGKRLKEEVVVKEGGGERKRIEKNKRRWKEKRRMKNGRRGGEG